MAEPDDATTPIGKACACLVDARGRLLVFDHPGGGGMQLVKGTIEPGESPADAARRELLEESGIRSDGEVQSLGTLLREGSASSEGDARRHRQLWHLFLMRTQRDLPDTFVHRATGSPDEEGLLFAFRWLEADDAVDGFALPYRQAIHRVRAVLLAPQVQTARAAM